MYVYIYTHVWVYLAITCDNIRLELVTSLPLAKGLEFESEHLPGGQVLICMLLGYVYVGLDPLLGLSHSNSQFAFFAGES
jgi:hypothetical protein